MAQVAGRYTVSALAVEFGLNRRTVSHRLKRMKPVDKIGRSFVYLIVDVAPALLGIFDAEPGAEQKLDPVQEGARAQKYKADKTKLEVEILRGNVFPGEMIAQKTSEMVANFRARMVGLASTLAPRVAGLSIREIEFEAKDIL